MARMPEPYVSFEDVNRTLEAYIPTMGAQKAYRLDRMQPLMEALGNPQHDFRTIHVAGTSGKTSTCYYIASLLVESGAKVGLTVSPHIDEVNERVQINLIPLPEKVYCIYFGEFMEILEQLPVRPTYFELLVAFAYWVFAREHVEYAVVEVGLGGLLDSTNVITRSDKVCVLTDIGMDHTDILGKTLPEIAAQKAGIIRPHNSVFMYQQQESVMQVVREVCEQQRAELHEILSSYDHKLPAKLPLFQKRNYYLAQQVTGFILGEHQHPLSSQDLQRASRVTIPGRMEIIAYGDKTIVLDGAHNAQKMDAFIESLRLKFPDKSFAMMVAMKRSKTSHLQSVMRKICQVASFSILTTLESGAGQKNSSLISPVKMAETCHILGYDDWDIVADPNEAFNALLSRPEQVLVVTGSFYLVGHIHDVLSRASV